MSDNLTRAGMAVTLSRKLGLSRPESLGLIDSVIRLMSGAVVRGENVKISGFGTFALRHKKERIGRNPKTGAEAPISARRVLTFRASKALKDRVARG